MPVVARLAYNVVRDDFFEFWSNFFGILKAANTSKGDLLVIGPANDATWNWILVGMSNGKKEICLLIRAETLYLFGWRQGSSGEENANKFFVVKDERVCDVPGEFDLLPFNGNYNKLPTLQKILITRAIVSKAIDQLHDSKKGALESSFLLFILISCASLRIVSIRDCIREAFLTNIGGRITEEMEQQEKNWSHASKAYITGEPKKFQGFGIVTEDNASEKITIALWNVGMKYDNLPIAPGWGLRQQPRRRVAVVDDLRVRVE